MATSVQNYKLLLFNVTGNRDSQSFLDVLSVRAACVCVHAVCARGIEMLTSVFLLFYLPFVCRIATMTLFCSVQVV